LTSTKEDAKPPNNGPPSVKKEEIIRSIILSIFDEDGPTPTVYWPLDMDEASRLLIAMKTISLLND